MTRIRRWFYITIACVFVWWHEIRHDTDDHNTLPPDSVPPYPSGMDCPDTEPTSPGALDTDRRRLQ